MFNGGFIWNDSKVFVKFYYGPNGGDIYTISGYMPSIFKKSSFIVSIFYTQYTFALFFKHLNFTLHISLAITWQQVFANLIESPPAPQNPSRTVSHLILLAIYSATASGVTLYQDS